MKIKKFDDVNILNDIVLFERYTSLNLPEAYRKFLSENNVCSVDPMGFYYKHTSNILPENLPGGMLSLFYGFSNKGEAWNLQWAYDVYVASKRVGSSYLPIACDAGGNQICIGVNSTNYGKIFFWNHEKEGLEGDFPYLLLADDFEAFLSSLKNIDEDLLF